MNGSQRAAMVSMMRECKSAEGFHRCVQTAMERDNVLPATADNIAFWAVAFGIKPGRGARFPHWRMTGAIADGKHFIHMGSYGYWRLYRDVDDFVAFNPSNPASAIAACPAITGRVLSPEDCAEYLRGMYGDRRHLIHRAFTSWQKARAFTPEMASAWPSQIQGIGDAIFARWNRLRSEEGELTDADFARMMDMGERQWA